MSRLEYILALIICVLDIFFNIASNLKAMLEKRREYKEPKNEVKNADK